MEIKTDYSLKSLNTFNINVDGKYFAEVASVIEIKEAIKFADARQIPLLVIGGGSNLLFRKNYPGFVMKINFRGIELVDETHENVIIKAGAGESWDDFVAYCVTHGYAGIENLSLIPGCVGASPVQNIGAYGVEMKDHFESLEYYHFKSGEIRYFTSDECRFGYRNSIFKNELKGQGVVLSVLFRLNKFPSFKTGYGAIREALSHQGVGELSLAAIRSAVIQIRQTKLPDPAEIGNAGSFFKNPTVSKNIHDLLIRENRKLVSFPQSGDTFKLAAGWLIDQCGWKGYREGDSGVHAKQALVLVNHGNATGLEIFNLSEKIRMSVLDRFYVELEREVNII